MLFLDSCNLLSLDKHLYCSRSSGRTHFFQISHPLQFINTATVLGYLFSGLVHNILLFVLFPGKAL